MSLLMSDSLKERIDVESLKEDHKNLKIDAQFYCLFKTKTQSFYAALNKFEDFEKHSIIVFDSESIDQNIFHHIINDEDLKSVSVFMSSLTEDFCMKKFDNISKVSVTKIERESLAGYNYLITIFISKA